MAIDASIALNANAPQPVNPLAQIGQFAQTANALTAYQNNRLALQGTQAQAQAYRDNTDTQGNTNYQGVIGELSQLPGGGAALPGAVEAMQQRQRGQYELNQDQLAQTENRTNVFNSALTPLLRLGSSVTPQDVYSTIGGLSNSGFPAGEFAKDAASTMPVMDPSQENNPQAKAAYGQQLQQWIYNHAGRSWGAAVGVQTATPHYQPQDTGGSIRMVDTNPFTNPSLAGGGEDVNKTFSPGEQADQVTLKDAAGNSFSVPRASLAGLQGQGNLVPPGNAPVTSPFGSGRYGAPSGAGPGGAQGAQGDEDPFAGGGTSTGTPPGGTTGPLGDPASGMPPGAIRTGLGPATQAARTVQGQEAGSEAAALSSYAQDIPNRKAMLSDMEADLSSAPTGPGAQNQAYWSAFANNHFPGLSSLVPGLVKSPQDVASFENFEKVAGRFAQSQATSLGPVTNDKLSSAMASNPNTVFSALGNTGVMHILQGNEDAINARNQAWQGYVQNGGDPANFQQWSSSFNNSGFDPRTFWMKNMTPGERSSYLATLTPSQATTFYNNIRTGIARGWVSPSDFTSPPASSGASSAPVANPANGY